MWLNDRNKTVLRDQQKKLEKEMRRRQFFQENKQKICLREYYRKEYGIKVNNKIMDLLTVSEFEEYLKRKLRQIKVQKALNVIEKHIIGFLCKLRFK
jgi:hypothetical protein